MTGARRTVVRIGLALLALTEVIVGGWAQVAPAGYYRAFPSAGHAWVALLPPYNEHLVRDVGSLSLALTFVLAVAAVVGEARLARIALIAFAIYGVPHAVFHALHLEGFPPWDAWAQTAGLVLQLVLAVAVFLLTLRRGGQALVGTSSPQ